jgi:hypothetical protein
MDINDKKKFFGAESKANYDSELSELDSDAESELDDLEKNYNQDDFICKNICPALAKIMGISVQTDKLSFNNWVQPTYSGLSNSKPIIKNINYNTNLIGDLDIIKNKIINYDNLNNKDLDFISELDSSDKFTLIKLFNQTNKDLVNNLLKILKK